MATIKSIHGFFLCWDQVANTLVANREVAGSWEDFEITKLWDNLVSIKASTGKLLTVEPDGRVVARGEEAGAWEQWEVVKVEGRTAFKSGNHLAPGFLTAELNGDVVVRSETPDAWQQWEVTGMGGEVIIPGGGGALDAAWGCVRAESGEVPIDNRGPFVPVGLHFGESFSAFCRGRKADVENELKIAVDHGYNFHRTWGNLGYYTDWRGREVAFHDFVGEDGRHISKTPDYYTRWHEYLQMCVRVGIRVSFDDGDMNSLPLRAIEDHQHLMRQVMDSYPHTVFSKQLANEKWQNFPSSKAFDENYAVSIMRAAFGGSQFILGNSAHVPDDKETHESGKGFAHMVNGFFWAGIVHGTRDFRDMEKVLRRFYNYGYERYPSGYGDRKYLMISMEPGGPGQGVTVGRTEDIWKICGMHIATLIGRTVPVYMSGNGVFWDGPIYNQPGYAETGRLGSIFPSNAFTFTSLHGNRSDAWFTSEGGFANEGSGYGRVDQLISDSNRFGLCIAHGGKGTRRIVTRRNVNVSVMALDLTSKFSGKFSAGQSFDAGGDTFFTATLL